MAAAGTVALVGQEQGKTKRKSAGETDLENQIRAHLRHRMTRRGEGPSEAARALGYSQSYVSRVLQGKRGVSAYFLYRLCKVYSIDPDLALNTPADPRFYGDWVPQAPAEDPPFASPPAQSAGRKSAGR